MPLGVLLKKMIETWNQTTNERINECFEDYIQKEQTGDVWFF